MVLLEVVATVPAGAAMHVHVEALGDISRYELYCGVAKMVPPELWHEDLAAHLYK